MIVKRVLTAVLALAVAIIGLANISPSRAADAPTGTFLGTWPYALKPNHHLGAFGTGGLDDNLGNIYRQMVHMPAAFYLWAESKYEPILGEKWGFTADNKAYSLTLRSDAKWSDGSAVTSEDLITTYALGRIIGWTQFNYISEVKKVDDNTAEFVFSGEPSLVAERLILKEYIIPTSTYGELAQKALALVADGKNKDSEEWKALATEIREFRPETLVSSGPFTYTLDDVGDTFMTLKWQPNSVFSSSVKFGEIRLWAGETDVTTPLVLSGDIAHSTNVYPAATQDKFKEAGIRLITTPRMYGPALLFQHDFYPFNLKEVRQAAALVINREQNAFVTLGLGATATVYMAGLLDDNVPTLLNQDTIDKLDRYAFDVDRASKILEGAGFARNADGKWADKDGKVVKAEFKFPAEFADFSAAAQDAIDQLNKFGFDITGRAAPWQQTADDIRAGNFELSVWSWASGSPFASRQFFGPVQRFNYVSFTDGRKGMNFPMEFEYNGAKIDLNKMINEASNGLDVEVQKQRAGEIALIINDLMPFIPLNIILSVEPFNETKIAGAPADGDPILKNPSSDHFVIWYMLQGMISPVQ
jgi:peptide/nickel transport system substrate-binding protein